MSEQVFKWAAMRDIQRNALIAEKIMGWQWVPYTFSDVSSTGDQLWLLPDAQSVASLTPGEWTYYEEDAQDQRITNRYLPTWLPCYTTSMDAAWEMVEQERLVIRPDLFHGWWAGTFVRVSLDNAQIGYEHPVRHDNPAEAICLAALKACGVEIEV